MDRGAGIQEVLTSLDPAGKAIREALFRKITPILAGSDAISDSDIRLMIQAQCLDMVAAIQELIEEYGLDGAQ